MSPSSGRRALPAMAGWLRTRALSLVETATTPLLPADYLDMVSPLRAGADLRGRIVDIRHETRDAVSLLIRPGRGWRGHTPGQYVRVGVDVDGVRLWRAYSLTSLSSRASSASSRPQAGGGNCIAITVKAIPDGKVSNHLVHHAQRGSVLYLDQACGDFVLPDPLPGKILFVTAGSGITPVMGMLRNHVRDLGKHTGTDVVLLHSAPTPQDVVFGAELRRLEPRIRLIERHTDTDGMLSTDELAALVPDLAERETWACGPTGLLDAVESYWDAKGIGPQLHTERFRPKVLTTGEGGTITFTDSDVTVEAPGDAPLLEVGEEAGVLMPSGCRMGICYGCVTPLREGSVRDLRDGTVTTAVAGDNVRVQTCVSAAAGDCELDR